MSHPVVEVVVYTVRPEHAERYVAELPQLHALLRTLPGFLGIATHRSSSDPVRFSDVCRWRSMTDASAAKTSVMDREDFGHFFRMMDTVTTFDHYETIAHS